MTEGRGESRSTTLRHLTGHVNWIGVGAMVALILAFYGGNPRVWIFVPILLVAVPLVALDGHYRYCPKDKP